MLLVTLAETTPVHEAAALQVDLRRSGIEPFGWVINATLAASGTRDPVLRQRATLEYRHLRRVKDELAARCWIVGGRAASASSAAGCSVGSPKIWWRFRKKLLERKVACVV